MAKKQEYFRKFPLINYRGTTAVNILSRIDLNSNVAKYYEAFYEYVLDDNTDIQNLAYDYYDDVDYDWMIYLTNDIIDPYYDIPLDTTNFNKFIKKKYGSIEKAQLEIVSYKTNYETQPDTILSPSQFNNLPGDVKKYWSPVETAVGVIAGYERDTTDIFISTNKIISLQFVAEENSTFTTGETVYIENSADNTAQVAAANTTSVILKHVSGNFNRSNNFNLIGQTSNENITIKFDAYTLLSQVIPAVEETYYSKYSAYQKEEAENESKRNLNLIENFLADDVNDAVTELLK